MVVLYNCLLHRAVYIHDTLPCTLKQGEIPAKEGVDKPLQTMAFTAKSRDYIISHARIFSVPQC